MMMTIDYAKNIPTDLLGAIALTVHRIVGNMPVAIKCMGSPGVLVDGGIIIDSAYESRELDRALDRPDVTRVRLSSGRHTGKEMYASSIVREGDTSKAIRVIGVIDTSGALAL